jgi:hypothetical protein
MLFEISNNSFPRISVCLDELYEATDETVCRWAVVLVVLEWVILKLLLVLNLVTRHHVAVLRDPTEQCLHDDFPDEHSIQLHNSSAESPGTQRSVGSRLSGDNLSSNVV